MKSRLVFAFVLAIVATAAVPAHSQTYSVLYNFNRYAGDGIGPLGTLVQDPAGNLYGTTQGGGKNSLGTVFRLSPKGEETILYNFTLPPDGMLPQRGVIRDRAGNLYGTTYEGGRYGTHNNFGTVFRLDAHVETVVHSFGSGHDGTYPNGDLIQDPRGNLYGVTGVGGTHGYGNVFKITPKGREIILHTFTGAEGAVPSGGLVRDGRGNLYGTTVSGGANGWGTVYEITAEGSYKVLYNFCALINCADGRQPLGGVVQDRAGSLYGTTIGGGAHNQGIVFKLRRAGEESVVHSFGFANQDGYLPWSGLILSSTS